MIAFCVAAFWVCWWKGEVEGRFHSGTLSCLYCCCVWITYSEEENMTLRILYILISFLKSYIFVTAVVIATFKFWIRLVYVHNYSLGFMI